MNETMLFSCLVPSTKKLELIGDNRQLQSYLHNRFDFERINSLNISLFERMVMSEMAPQVSLLAIQRRMRKNICDLHRGLYSDLVQIEDEKQCQRKRIGDSSKSSSILQVPGEGRETPGVMPHLFFWTHNGVQSKATVGVSKINNTEVRMVVGLAMHLVACGVPKDSIAVITPYKGQLMELRKALIKERIFDPPSKVPQVSRQGCSFLSVEYC